MNRTAQPVRLLLAATAATLALVGSAAAQQQTISPALKEVIEAAKKEGKLEAQWAPSLFGGGEGGKNLAAAMNKAYGTDIQFQFVMGPPSVPQILDNIALSQRTNRPSPTNIFLAPTELQGAAKNRNMLMSVDWTALNPQRIDSSKVEAGGTSVRVFTTLPGGIVYNSKLAPSKPARLTDLLAPEWKGKIASTPYAAAFDLLGATDRWGEEKAIDFTTKFSKQISGLIGCPDIERIASGEFVAMAMDCSGRDWVKYKRNGAPVDFVVPQDNAIKRYYYVGIPKNAPQPNAAKLFIQFVMTPQGQEIVWKGMDTDLSDFPDSRMAKVIADYEKQGVKFDNLTIEWFDRHPELNKLRPLTVKIITSGR